MPTLTVQNGLLKGREFEVDRDVVIGRGAGVDLALSDPGVSRRHARIRHESGNWLVEDLGSANGTVVNGWRVARPTSLADGDVIGMGVVFVEFGHSRASAMPSPAGLAEVRYRDDDDEPAVLLSLREGADDEAAAPRPEEVARLRFLADFARIGSMVFDEPALAAFVADELLALIPKADRAVVLVRDGQELRPRALRLRTGQPKDIVVSRRLLEDVMARREAVLAVDAQSDERYASSQSIFDLGIRSAILAPMSFQDQIYGVVQIDSALAGVPFDKADVALVLSLASQLGMAVGYARVHAELVDQQIVQRDVALARRIQQQFLPTGSLDFPGFAAAMDYRPAQGVSGDFCDRLALDCGRVGLVIGDVSGKGVSAALFAAKLMTDLRYQSVGQTEPREILARTNAIVAGHDHEGMFATAIVLVVDPGTGQVDLANAGHPLPYLRRADGTVSEVGQPGGSPIGLQSGATFSVARVTLGPGDALLLCTDGVIEALDEHQELFGERRTLDAVAASDGTVDGVLVSLRAALAAFVGSAPQSDDVTLLCLRRAPH